MKLTKAAIDRLKYDGRTKSIHMDDELAGFGVRIFKSGAMSFFFTYSAGGRRRYLTLGDYGSLTPDQARKMAAVKRGEVLKGGDPLADKQKAIRGESVADLAEVYIERHARPRNKSWEKDQERIDRYILPAFGAVKVTAITRRDVSKLHDKIGRRHPTTANRVVALLSTMFQKAQMWGMLPETAANPARHIERFEEVKRDRFVTQKEMPALAKAIDAEPNVYVKALIWLYLFTGLRKTELQTLRWEDVDLEDAQLTLKDTKAGRPHYLPLSSEALLLFQSIPRIHRNPYVFCGRDAGKPIVNVATAWKRIRIRAKLEDVRLHDLRRTVGSWIAQSGGSLPLIGRILNQSNVSTTQIYARFHQDPVTEALEKHGQNIRDAVGPHLLPSDAVLATVSSDVDR